MKPVHAGLSACSADFSLCFLDIIDNLCFLAKQKEIGDFLRFSKSRELVF